MIKINITIEFDKDKNNIFSDTSDNNNIKIVKKKPTRTKIIKVNTKELLKRIYIEIPTSLRTSF